MYLEILIVVALIALNGCLAMSEMAIVSAKPGRLKHLQETSRGAAAALRLAEHPGRFLSTVQIGITLVGVLSGAISGATLGARLASSLHGWGVDLELAQTLGVGGVVVIITYVSLIAGELVPKQIALRDPEGIAILVAPPMAILSKVAAPIVWFLDISGRAVLWLMGQRGSGNARVTEEEVKSLLSEAAEIGVIEVEERALMAGVMRLGDRTAKALMTPRHEVAMLDLESTPAEAIGAIRRISRPRMPVQSRESGDVVGIVLLSEAFDAVSRREPLNIRALVREVPAVSDRADALDVMGIIASTPHHMALVYDEYGHFEGIITTGDVLEAITGTIASAEEGEEPMVERADGSLLVAGWMPVDEFADRIGIRRELAGDYDTVAGLMLHLMGRLPRLGETVKADGWTFEIIDMDGLRIDKVLATRQ